MNSYCKGCGRYRAECEGRVCPSCSEAGRTICPRTIRRFNINPRGLLSEYEHGDLVHAADAITLVNELKASADKEIARLTAERNEAREWVRRMHAENTTTCVWCGEKFPPGTPGAGAAVLLEHAKTCREHPLRTALEENQRLRRMVGVLAEDAEWSHCGREALTACGLWQGGQPTLECTELITAAKEKPHG